MGLIPPQEMKIPHAVRVTRKKKKMTDFFALLVDGTVSLNFYSEQRQFLPGLRKLEQTLSSMGCLRSFERHGLGTALSQNL